MSKFKGVAAKMVAASKGENDGLAEPDADDVIAKVVKKTTKKSAPPFAKKSSGKPQYKNTAARMLALRRSKK